MSLKINKNLKNIKKVVKKELAKIDIKKLRIITIILLLLGLLYLGKSLIIAAWVNNRPLFRISLIKELEKQGGKSILENQIEKSLIFQEAKRRKITVSKEDIDKEIENIKTLIKGQGISIEDVISSRGQTMDDFKEQLKIQKYVETILADKIIVSEDDIVKYYNDKKSFYGKDETLDKVRVQIKQELEQSKLAEEYQKWINELKAKAKILYFVKY